MKILIHTRNADLAEDFRIIAEDIFSLERRNGIAAVDESGNYGAALIVVILSDGVDSEARRKRTILSSTTISDKSFNCTSGWIKQK